MAEACPTARIGAEIVPAGVVRHQHDDVGPLLLCLRRLDLRRRDSQQYPNGNVAEQPVEKFMSHCVTPIEVRRQVPLV